MSDFSPLRIRRGVGVAKTVSRVVTAGSMASENCSGNITHLFHFRTKPLSVVGVRNGSRLSGQEVDAGHQIRTGHQLMGGAAAHARATAPTVKGFALGRGATVQAFTLDHARWSRCRRSHWITPGGRGAGVRTGSRQVVEVQRSNATNAAGGGRFQGGNPLRSNLAPFAVIRQSSRKAG